MLRGEALPLAAKEIHALRDRIVREYGEEVVGTPSGPILLIRVPHHEPDFLRDLDNAVDLLPYRDMKGFRSVILLGDRGHMAVSPDMLRALMEGKVQAEKQWIARLRVDLGPGAFRVTKMPGDPQRRLRAVFRVEVDSVSELDEPDFEPMAEALPEIKAASPGQTRPAFVHLVAHGDHVTIDGARFFTDLERRRKRHVDTLSERARRELEEKHEIALANLDRVLKQRTETRARSGDPPPARSPFPAPPVHVPRGSTTAPPAPSRTVEAYTPPTPPTPLAPVDRFAAASRHQTQAKRLREALEAAGYRTKERLVVRDVPVAIAAARPEGYPTRVLVTFHSRLEPDMAQALLLVARHVGADLMLAIAEDVAPGVDRVTLATNLKVIPPDAVPDVRFG